MNKINLGIIGAGKICIHHLDVIVNIKEFNLYAITSRTKYKSQKLRKKYRIKNIYNNVKLLISDQKIDAIFILVSADQIYKILKIIIPTKIPFFVEKPICLNHEEYKFLNKLITKYNSLNMVGHNRRFYSNFQKAKDLINKNGKLLGIIIEGHERIWKILNKKTILTNKWIYANSIHTIDLLRFFGGELESFAFFKNSLKIKNGDQFALSFKFRSKAVGVYISNWFSPGGWSIKLFGEGISVVFDNLENGYWINKNFKKYKINNDKYDNIYKPGFYKQTKAFLYLLKNNKLKYPSQDILDALKSIKLINKLQIK